MAKSITGYKQDIDKYIKKSDHLAFVSLLQQMAEAIPPDEIGHLSPADVYQSALSLWNFSQHRLSTVAKVRILHPRMHTVAWSGKQAVIEIVNDDMPFLVDSVTAEINRLGFSVYLILHPIIDVPRDAAGQVAVHGTLTRESVMHIKINEFVPPEALSLLEQNILAVLQDVRQTVDDWPAMQAALTSVYQEMAASCDEERAFLQWLQQNHFTFLGYRDIRFASKGKKSGKMIVDPEAGLGLLRDPQRPVFDGVRDLNDLPEAFLSFLHNQAPLLITKTNRHATVHRTVPMDCLDIKRYDQSGNVVGLHRFVGLFTSNTYSDSAQSIPIVRRKIQYVLKKAGFDPRGHNGKALLHILESFPRDELYQISDEELASISLGILHLQERQRVALFHRVVASGRFISCFVFIPRDRYTLFVRQKVQEVLQTGFSAKTKSAHVHVADDALARLYFVLETESPAAGYDNAAIERALREACRSWEDNFLTILHGELDLSEASLLHGRYAKAFPLAYQEQFQHQHIWRDIVTLENLYRDETIKIGLFATTGALPHFFGLKIYALDNPLPLSDILPVLENLGLHVLSETSFHIKPSHSTTAAWIHYFEVATKNRQQVDLPAAELHLQDAVHHIWTKACEDDALNQLILSAGVNWREVTILRAYAAYMKQIKFAYEQEAVVSAIVKHPFIAKALIDFFLMRFYPLVNQKRDTQVKAAQENLEEHFNTVDSLADDRILRRCLDLMQATLRTNYFQDKVLYAERPYLSLKFDGMQVPDLPLPRPFREIFVYSPYFEAVHLRGGKVARGGIRWSDRKEDFRTEILGLMKAQRVKNAVIVPSGAKGGFIVKVPLDRAYPEQVSREVERCYRLMIASLLEITDTVTSASLQPPEQVLRHDEDDPYLVVAADKGTATFSDIANSIAEAKGFWLGDAFASGGSAGYDHKKMGITARGAWEAVKRHFREMGRDIQREDFTVIGVGDMSGDVFGNGMLLSRHIKLIAAFNHQHIFVDPDPDTERSYAERQRLFTLPRSTWKDYDIKALSAGGGIYARSDKAITLSEQARHLFGLTDTKTTPNALIQALLTHPVELLWFGGIGTFVRSSQESNDKVSDKANDAVRIEARQLQAKVIGEGANLGMTQAARIEYALAGGRLNTDAIDNSGGVDCSDHEVNIKIVLNRLMQDGILPRPARDALLAEMTEAVATLVLRNNFLQTQALSMMAQEGSDALPAQQRLIRHLEEKGMLDRALEYLPTDSQIQERQAARIGLTRPELAVVMAYAKMDLTEQLIQSKLPTEPHMDGELLRYFPTLMQERYTDAIRQHRLRRELIATATANSVINRMGATFVHDIHVITGAPVCDILRCYTVVRDSAALRSEWQQLEAQDTANTTTPISGRLMILRQFVHSSVLWLLHNEPHPLNVTAMIQQLRPKFAALTEYIEGTGTARQQPAFFAKMTTAFDIFRIAHENNTSLPFTASVYQQLENLLSVHRIMTYADSLRVQTPVQEQALWTLRFEIRRNFSQIASNFLRCSTQSNSEALEVWLRKTRPLTAEKIQTSLQEVESTGVKDMAVLLVINRLLSQAF